MRLHVWDLFTPEEYLSARDAKLITVREDPAGTGLLILNYSDSAMYTEGAWNNPAVRACRGLIVDQEFFVVARPWSKFFNHGQQEAGLLDMDAPVQVTDKMDGSLGIIFQDPTGAVRVATRGSFASEQAVEASEMVLKYVPGLEHLSDVTPLVEIIYPSNRIVCDYGDRRELVLLGGVHIRTGEYMGPELTADYVSWGGPQTEVFSYRTLHEALQAPPRPGAEGLCVRMENESKIVKIKQEDYVALHRIVTGLSERSVWEHMTSGSSIEDLLGSLPDELHEWTRQVWNRIAEEASGLLVETQLAYSSILDSLPDSAGRKEFAERAKTFAPLTPWLFHLLDNRDPYPAIIRTLKPAGDARAKTLSEATA